MQRALRACAAALRTADLLGASTVLRRSAAHAQASLRRQRSAGAYVPFPRTRVLPVSTTKMRDSAARPAQVVSRRGRVRKEPERLEAGPASIVWSSTTNGTAAPEASTRKRSKKQLPSTPRKSTTPEGFRARQLATSELNDRQMELLGLYTKMFPIQAAEDPDFMIETVSTSTSFVIRHGKTRQVVAGISFKTFANQKMATVEYITTTVQHMGHGTVRETGAPAARMCTRVSAHHVRAHRVRLTPSRHYCGTGSAGHAVRPYAEDEPARRHDALRLCASEFLRHACSTPS